MTARVLPFCAPLLGAALALPGCAAKPATPARPAFDDIQVTTHGHDADSDFCADFTLTAPQVRTFLTRADAVDAMTLHDRYDTLPCWVRGTARDALGVWHWEIRAGGTARLESPKGAVRLLGCDACDDLLGGSKR